MLASWEFQPLTRHSPSTSPPASKCSHPTPTPRPSLRSTATSPRAVPSPISSAPPTPRRSSWCRPPAQPGAAPIRHGTTGRFGLKVEQVFKYAGSMSDQCELATPDHDSVALVREHILGADVADRVASSFWALSDPTRVRIIHA